MSRVVSVWFHSKRWELVGHIHVWVMLLLEAETTFSSLNKMSDSILWPILFIYGRLCVLLSQPHWRSFFNEELPTQIYHTINHTMLEELRLIWTIIAWGVCKPQGQSAGLPPSSQPAVISPTWSANCFQGYWINGAPRCSNEVSYDSRRSPDEKHCKIRQTDSVCCFCVSEINQNFLPSPTHFTVHRGSSIGAPEVFRSFLEDLWVRG